MAVNTRSMVNQIQSLAAVAEILDQADIRVVRVEWAEYREPTIQVGSRTDLDRAIEQFRLRPGSLYGDYNKPQMDAVGVIHDIHVRIFGSAQ